MLSKSEREAIRRLHPVHLVDEDDFTISGDLSPLELAELMPDDEERVRTIYDHNPEFEPTDEDLADMEEWLDSIQEEYN